MSEVAEQLTKTRPAVSRQRESVEHYSQMDSADFFRKERAKWEICRNLVDHLFEEIQQQPGEVYSPEETWPAFPLLVCNIVLGIHGFATTEPPVEAKALTEALMERISASPLSTSIGRFASDREQVLA